VTWYLNVSMEHEPFDLGLDDRDRIMIAFNFIARKRWSAFFTQEIAKRLQDEGVGTIGSSIFYSARVALPHKTTPYLVIIETGGAFPELTHNLTSEPAYVRPGAQVIVRAGNYEGAQAMAAAAYIALISIRNQELFA
jgi:hypothetical protein